MALLFIDFEWWKDAKGYRLAAPEPGTLAGSLLESVGKPQRVVPNGGKRIAYRPLDRFDQLYMAFAGVQTPENLLHFIENYGPLTAHGLQPDRGDRVPFVLGQAAMFRDWLDANHRRRKELVAGVGEDGEKFGSLDFSLTANTSGVVRLRVFPRTLLSALRLQLAQTLSGGTKIRACLHCGKWFEAGPGTDRRLDAKFCSDDHRVLYNSLKRSKGE